MSWSDKFFAIGIILLIIGTLFGIVFIVINSTHKSITTSNIKQISREESIKNTNPQIVFNGVTLKDSTQELLGNICVAERNGMRVEIANCHAQDIDGIDISHYINFTQDSDTTWIFVYSDTLESGNVQLYKNKSYTAYVDHAVSIWTNNFLVDKVTSYINLGTPDSSCKIGNSNNTKMYDVTRAINGSLTERYCFTDITTINSTAFRISGNRDGIQTTQEPASKYEWTDITNLFSRVGKGLINDTREYYKVSDVNAGSYFTKWTFTPHNKGKSGKWHILGYPSSKTLLQALAEDDYLYIDPFWDNNWVWCMNMTVPGGQSALNNFPFIVNVTYNQNMSFPNMHDIRFVNASCNNGGSEMPYNTIIVVNNSSFMAEVKAVNLATGNNVFSVYYSNPGASNNDPTGVYDNAYWAVLHLEEAPGATAVDMTSNSNNFSIGAQISSVTGLFGQASRASANTGVGIKNITSWKNLNESFTVMMWTYYYAFSTIDAFFSTGNGASGSLNLRGSGDFGGNVIDMRMGTAGNYYYTPSNTSFTTGVWRHVAVTYDNTSATNNFKLYVNGVIENISGAPQTLQLPEASGAGYTERGILYVPAYLKDYSDGYQPNGAVDEFSWSQSPRSTAWINRTAMNVYQNLITFGAPQINGTSGGGGGDATPPVVNLIAPQSGSTIDTTYVSFNATFTDDVNVSNATFFLWNASNLAIANQTLIILPGPNSSVNLTVYFPYNGTFYWNYLASDNSSNWAFNKTNWTITYSANPGDITPPIYGSLNATPSPATYASLQTYSFNISWSNMNGTGIAILQFNGTNYTASNVSGGNYNVTIKDLSAGNYSYYWWANDSSNNGNSTPIQSYNISKANPSLSINILPSSNVFNGTATTAWTGTHSCGGLTLPSWGFFINGTAVGDPDASTYGPGTFIYVANTSETQNCSNGSTSSTLYVTIEPDTTAPNVNITYPRNNFIIPYYVAGSNLTLNYTVNDSFASACWYQYNGDWPINIFSFESGFEGWTPSATRATRSTSWATLGSYSVQLTAFGGVGGGQGTINKTILSSGDLTFDANVTVNGGASSRLKVSVNGVEVYSNSTGTVSGQNISVTAGDLVEFRAVASTGWSTTVYVDNITIPGNPFNGTIVSCTTNTTSFKPQNQQSIYFFSNDTSGNVGYTYSNWSYGVVENNQTYTNVTYETSAEVFTLNLSYSSGWTGIVNFDYNGTLYPSTSSSDGTNSIYTTTVNIPLIYKPTDTKNFHWEIQATHGVDNYYFNSTIRPQVIKEILFTKCNATYATPVYVNYSIWDENTLALITPGLYANNFLATFNYNLGGTDFKNNTFSTPTGLNNYTFCTNINRTFTVSPYISVVYPGYASRNFEILLDSYTNASVTERKLYLLNSGNATSVIIRVKNSSNLPAPDIYTEVYRYYPSTDTYLLVENDRTDLYGQFVAQLIQNTVKYKFVFKDAAGNVLKTSDKVTVACLAAICILPFVLEDTTNDFAQFQNTSGNTWNFYFNNNTNTYIYSWNDVSGINATKRLYVQRVLANGTSTPCNLSTTNASGTLTCYVGNSSASYIAQVYRVSVTLNQRLGSLNNQVGADYPSGTEGLIWSILILMTCIAFGYWKPPVGFILFGAVSALLYFIHILYLNPAILIAEWIIVGIFAWAFRG